MVLDNLVSNASGIIGDFFEHATQLIDAVKGIRELGVGNRVSALSLDLESKLITAQRLTFTLQAEHATALCRTTELEEEIKKLRNWAEEKTNYELKEIFPGTHVYSLKPNIQGHGSQHHICPNCYENAVKTILQSSGYTKVHKTLVCHTCNATFLGEQIPMHPTTGGGRFTIPGYI